MFVMEKRKGFTLVELLVVIGIISGLIAILLPALSGRTLGPDHPMCQQFAANWNGLPRVFQDNRGYICPADLPWAYNTGDATRWTVEMVLGRYLIDQGLIYNVNGNEGNTLYSNGHNILVCPADDEAIACSTIDGNAGGCSYIGNAGCMGTPIGSSNPEPKTWIYPETSGWAPGITSNINVQFPVKYSQFKHSADVLLMTEKAGNQQSTSVNGGEVLVTNPLMGNFRGDLRARHGNKRIYGESGSTALGSNGIYDHMNVLYLDGHVGLETLEFVYYASRATDAPWATLVQRPAGRTVSGSDGVSDGR